MRQRFRHGLFQLINPIPTTGSSGARLRARARVGRAPLAFSPGGIVTLILLVVFHAGCSKTEKKQSEVPRTRVPGLHIVQAVEHAGGSEIWIREQERRRPAPGQAGGSAEVLATPARYKEVLNAIQREANTEGLRIETRGKKSGGKSPSVDLSLYRQKEFVGQWHVREVPKILRAAIVIDDMGQDLEAAKKLLHQPFPLTFSVLPELAFSSQTARMAHEAHRAVMLHLPMQPEPGAGANPGPGEIKVGMSSDEVGKIIRADLSTVPFAEGVNNHMGSRATTDEALMDDVMKVLRARGLYFVDSRTTASTRALVAARRQGLPAFYRSVFLDDTETVAYTLEQLRTFRRVVQDHGVALAIGHPHPSTIEALREFLPEFDRADIQLIPASQLVHLPEATQLGPPHHATSVANTSSLLKNELSL